MKTAIIGGGAAGFFLAINLKEMCPKMQIAILEKGTRVLRKVEVSGGGRCNCTNSFEAVNDLKSVYPRGHRLMRRLFNVFDYHDAYEWFEQHGVPLVAQDDHCVFPRSQDAHTIVNMFMNEALRLGVEIRTGVTIDSIDTLQDYDFVCVTTGGQPRRDALAWLNEDIVDPVPSLFTFSIGDERLHALMGTVVEGATTILPGTKLRATGPLLLTHWGMSGPAILRLSSYGARILADGDYRHPLCINWLSKSVDETMQLLQEMMQMHPQRLLTNAHLQGVQQRLWQYLTEKCLSDRAHTPWDSLNKKELNRLVNTLTADTYQINGRAPFRDEFVTCGGVALQAVDLNTLESKKHPGRYYAGEVLDIDGITGGFNFQAAWTTAYTVASAITNAADSHAK